MRLLAGKGLVLVCRSLARLDIDGPIAAQEQWWTWSIHVLINQNHHVCCSFREHNFTKWNPDSELSQTSIVVGMVWVRNINCITFQRDAHRYTTMIYLIQNTSRFVTCWAALPPTMLSHHYTHTHKGFNSVLMRAREENGLVNNGGNGRAIEKSETSDQKTLVPSRWWWARTPSRSFLLRGG